MTTLINILLFSLLNLVTGARQPGAPTEATLLFVGDAMQHQAQLDRAKELGGGSHYYGDCFSLIAPEVVKADYAVVNLEVPLGGGPDYSGYPMFSAPDDFAKELRDHGFDLFLTANNHCLDRRGKGGLRTLDVLDRLGVDHIGTFRDSLERKKNVPFIKDIKGIKVGFLNYTYGTNGISPDRGIEVAYINKNRMAQEIAATRNAGAEIVVVTVHWGVEYVLNENASQRELGDYLLEQGADMVIGGHPHVVQPWKIVDNKSTGKKGLIVYSLGNFISNMKTGDTRGGGMITVTLRRGANGRAEIAEVEGDLLFSAKPEGKGNFQVIPASRQDKIPSSQKGHWETFRRSAEKVFPVGVRK